MHVWKLEFKCDHYHVYSAYLVSDSIEATTKQLTELFENNKGKSLSIVKKNFENYGLENLVKEVEDVCDPLRDEIILYKYYHKVVKRYIYMGGPEIVLNREIEEGVEH